MNEKMILTAQAGAMQLALAEAGSPEVRMLTPETALCEGVSFAKRPIFVRHICPAQIQVQLTGAREDMYTLLRALARIKNRLNKEHSFSIQTRILEGVQPEYKRFDINTALCDMLTADGYTVDVKKPEQIVSVTVGMEEGFLGISTPEENFSDWAGGARRYKKEENQVSRAEFKLLEAIETFRIPIPENGTALDLGAAPGGWTAALRERGLQVTAVDPAFLDERVAKDKGVTHLRITAQEFFRRNPLPFDLMVNDMKMDSAQSAMLMAEGAECLKAGGYLVLTLKLPDRPVTWPGRAAQAERILAEKYEIVGIRQLFHNRSEVTLVARRK